MKKTMDIVTQEEIAKQNRDRANLRDSDPLAKSDYYLRVRRFMELAGQPFAEGPTTPTADTRLLAAKLLLEETMETINALGVAPIPKGNGEYDFYVRTAPTAFNMKEATDGCCDVIFVCHWVLNSIGVSDVLPMLEVNDSNDRKFGVGSWKDEHGKVRKPEGWTGPDIEGAIDAQKMAACKLRNS